MPRKKKIDSEPVVIPEPPKPAPEELSKTRKPYPSREQRLAMAEEEILHWEKLNAERRDLIEKTEKKLEERKDALAKGEYALEKAHVKRDRIYSNLDKPTAPIKTVNKQYQELLAALQANGKSIDDLIADLRGA